MEKAEDIQFHLSNTTYIFTAVKYNFYIFTAVKYSFFFKYAFYLINIFLYFITLYIINGHIVSGNEELQQMIAQSQSFLAGVPASSSYRYTPNRGLKVPRVDYVCTHI